MNPHDPAPPPILRPPPAPIQPPAQPTPKRSKIFTGCLWAGGVLFGLAFLALLAPDDESARESTTPPAQKDNTRSPSISDTGKMTIVDTGFVGCVEINDLKKMLRFLAQKDRAAFDKILLDGIAKGTSTVFQKGEVVFLVKGEFFTGKMKVRRDGETKEYWTIKDATGF